MSSLCFGGKWRAAEPPPKFRFLASLSELLCLTNSSTNRCEADVRKEEN